MNKKNYINYNGLKKTYFEKKKKFKSINFYHKNNINFSKLDYLLDTNNKKCIIYIHGFNDYFYQYHISDYFMENNYDFYSITLNNYGSTKTDKIYYINNFKDYFIDIDNSIEYIKNQKNYNNILLFGHSMGGLLSIIYLDSGFYKDYINGLILNSPFFEFYNEKIMIILIKTIGYILGYFFPKIKLRKENNKPNNYSKAIKKRFYFESKYKLSTSPVYAGWIKTIIDNQMKIKNKKIKINKPIICLSSDKSNLKFDDKSDSILNINDINKYCNFISNNINYIYVKNAIHDIFVSDKETVNNAFYSLEKWLINKKFI